jgi:hypothetical protein
MTRDDQRTGGPDIRYLSTRAEQEKVADLLLPVLQKGGGE